MSTAILDEEIRNETAKLHEAETRAAEAARRLAQRPDNAKARADSIQAYRDISDIRAGIEALGKARSVSLDLDYEIAKEARLFEIPKAQDAVKALLAERVAAGKAVDDALATLHEAAQHWVALSRETTQAVRDFKRLCCPHERDLSDLRIGDEASTRIAQQVCAATRGLDTYGVMHFNLSGLESMPPVADAARKKAEFMAAVLKQYAERAAQ